MTVPEDGRHTLAGLRLALETDLHRIHALIAAAYGPYVAQLGVRPGPMDDDYAVHIAHGHVQVVDDAGALRGLLILIPQADAMLLDNIAIAPEAQGTGMGRALMRVAEDAARGAGLLHMRLYTHEGMTRNRALYARAGFVETRRVFEQGLARVYMEKALR